MCVANEVMDFGLASVGNAEEVAIVADLHLNPLAVVIESKACAEIGYAEFACAPIARVGV